MMDTSSPGPTMISVVSWRAETAVSNWVPNRSVSRRCRAMSVTGILSGAGLASDAGRDGRSHPTICPLPTTLQDQLLELEHAVDEALRPRRASGHVHIHGHHAIDALDCGVGALVAATRAGAVAHRDTPLGLRHLLPEADERAGHLGREGACDDEHVSLAGAGPEGEHVEAVHVVDAGGSGHHLHGA